MNDRQMQELRAMMAAEGLSVERMHRCGINGFLRIEGEIAAGQAMETGWICLAVVEGVYTLVSIDAQSWADCEAEPLTISPEEEARL